MIDSPALLADLKRVLKSLEDDLRERAEDDTTEWGARLRDEHRRAQARERTAMPWIEWRNGEVSQAAVAWIIATVFIRFAEDNGLLVGVELGSERVSLPWITAPSDGLERAVENEAAFYAALPTRTSRDWLQHAFATLAALPAGRPLVNPDHSPVWHAPISAAAADALLVFFRRTTPDGELVHNFSDPELSTRFLGDLYQDLSDYAKKTYALLQTPVFVEEFILDLTLTPAIAEFGLTGLKLIDPACGSGHFLLGAFERLVAKWAEVAPGVERGERVQRALESVHGVDLNPFAIAIARFRLTVAAIKAAGIQTLVAAPAFRYRLAIGDSLLGSVNPNAGLDLGDDEYFEYDSEDLREYSGLLEGGQYHVVVANPPYIPPADARLRDRYRSLYPTCSGRYVLSVPFMELLFRLARRSGGAAGYVGQITSNSFMKREFGKKIVEQFLSGNFTGVAPDYVELEKVVDVSRAYIPGHNSEGTATVALFGRPRRPRSRTVRAVMGIRGESQTPTDPANAPVWREIVDNIENPGFNGRYVSVADVERTAFATFPWSLSGGGARETKAMLEAAGVTTVGEEVVELGIAAVTGEDEFFNLGSRKNAERLGVEARGLAEGNLIRDWTIGEPEVAIWPYSRDYSVRPMEDLSVGLQRLYWRYKYAINRRRRFGTPMVDRGLTWWEWQELYTDKLRTPSTITFPLVATSNHFALDREGGLFKNSALVIKLDESSSVDDHLALLSVLNSSAACFWIQEVSQQKQGGSERWDWHFETGATKLQDFPLPRHRERELAQLIDDKARLHARSRPSVVIGSGPGALGAARDQFDRLRGELVALQEELDWRVYAAYGLVAEDLAPPLARDWVAIEPNARPCEVRLAREIDRGDTKTSWFERHARPALRDFPPDWPTWYRDLAERRLAAIDSNASLRLLEQPEYKRRWAGVPWDQLVQEAVQATLLDRLESVNLWRDAAGRPLVRSAAQVADDLHRDDQFRELVSIIAGSQDFDLTAEVRKLLAGEAVPGLAALRYKPSGIEKFRAWEHTWEVQRAEDRGERVHVPVPPKFGPTDFLKPSYWSARGKLDVPKERFISFPGSKLPDDETEVYGWSGWDHGERGQAIARFANDLARAGASDEQITPLVGVLLELEPWLKQWHDEIDPRAGVSAAAAVEGLTTSLLGRLGLGRDQIIAWRPPAATRGRRRAS